MRSKSDEIENRVPGARSRHIALSVQVAYIQVTHFSPGKSHWNFQMDRVKRGAAPPNLRTRVKVRADRIVLATALEILHK